MRNNTLGGLVIFMVVVTCLLLLDDISNPAELENTEQTEAIEKTRPQTDLAVIETEE